MIYLPYSGIGSRRTPQEIIRLMEKIGHRLAELGFTLRSGGAPGADQAFERGHSKFTSKNKEIYIPWSGFEGYAENSAIVLNSVSSASRAFEIAEKYHPSWDSLSRGAKKLMARNTYQVLGPNLTSKSLFVVCWTQDGAESTKECSAKTGGTGQAIRIADDYHIPIFNLQKPDALERLGELVNFIVDIVRNKNS